MSSIRSVQIAACALAIITASVSDCRNADSPAPLKHPPGPGGVIGIPPFQPPEKKTNPGALRIGDAAPSLAVEHWVQGEPIERFAPGKVYVLDFWATWSKPCHVTLPYLANLHDEYKDRVRVVSVTAENEDVVTRFLEKDASDGKRWGQVVKHSLALDSNSATIAAYLEAAEQDRPTAFIVGRDGVIEWIGHPLQIGDPLAQIVGDSWNRAAAIDRFPHEQALRQASSQLELMKRYEKWDTLIEALETLEDQMGPSVVWTRQKLSALQQAGRADEVGELEAELVDRSWNDAMALNRFAWETATKSGRRNLELARKAALRASELQENANPLTLDTVARVFYELGQLDEAIRWQRKAAETNDGIAGIEQTLTKYEAEAASSRPAPAPAPPSQDAAGTASADPDSAGR